MPKSLWACRRGRPIPVIDLFAGPGGLGEGFSRAGTGQLFKTVLSVEMERFAHSTLTLRAFQRALEASGTRRLPKEIIELLRGNILLDELLARFPDQGTVATEEALRMELSPDNRSEIFLRIKEKLKKSGSPGRWVLIGGPPCQAYSLAGRSRRSRALSEGTYKREDDNRHFLYEEYLNIIAELEPAVFVMENVKGLLSSSVGGSNMFSKIQADLKSPHKSISSSRHTKYQLYPIALDSTKLLNSHSADSFIIRAETCGVPQKRHRVIIIGVREDIQFDPQKLYLDSSEAPTLEEVIGDLPRVRSGLSREPDSNERWFRAINNADWEEIIQGTSTIPDIHGKKNLLKAILSAAGDPDLRGDDGIGRGAKVIELGKPVQPKALSSWFKSDRPNLVFNHETKSHMIKDLHRYLFASVFAEELGRNSKMGDLPDLLLPDHANARISAESNQLHADRFRVQLRNSVAMTVTSHISKDGHAYIHYDPKQCRALTVREAARIQTFPDDYCFLGPKTAQYHQVGNAVPPYLAFQIAEAIVRATGNDR